MSGMHHILSGKAGNRLNIPVMSIAQETTNYTNTLERSSSNDWIKNDFFSFSSFLIFPHFCVEHDLL